MIREQTEIVRKFRVECDSCRAHLGLPWSAAQREAETLAEAVGLAAVPLTQWRGQWVAHLCRKCRGELEATTTEAKGTEACPP